MQKIPRKATTRVYWNKLIAPMFTKITMYPSTVIFNPTVVKSGVTHSFKSLVSKVELFVLKHLQCKCALDHRSIADTNADVQVQNMYCTSER